MCVTAPAMCGCCRKRTIWRAGAGWRAYRSWPPASWAFWRNEPENPTLAGFLDEVALYTDLDSQADSDNCVTLMTMHSAKGLEFPCVFVVGMEDGLFPGNRAMGDEEEMEEERRLCYVAMTRAKEKLTLTNTRQRTCTAVPAPYALPLSQGDPGREHGVAGEARTPAGGVPLGGGSGSVLPLRHRYVPVGRSRSDLQRLRPLRRCGLAPQHPLRP